MPNPLTTSRNKYYNNRKNSRIYTPLSVVEFLKEILTPYLQKSYSENIILDPAVGKGNLLYPFFKDKKFQKQFRYVGFDIVDDKNRYSFIKFHKQDFLEYYGKEYQNKIRLVICNPPFNNESDSKYKRKFLPELFLKHIFNLYGQKIPLILFAPMGFRLNQRTFSKRWKSLRDDYSNAKITSIISMPLNIFPNVEFHNEILIWNIEELDAHYWFPEKYLI